MPSQRHTATYPGDPLLAALHTCVMDLGWRRTTLADVARRAGVSRMTLYRQYGDLPGIVSALLTGELGALLDEVRAEVAGLPTARARLAEAGVLMVGRLARHPLFRKVLDVDPELLLPLVVDRLGSTQRAAVALVAEHLEEGQRDGSIRPLDREVAATVVQLCLQSFVFSAKVVETALAEADVHDELRRLLDRYLRPDSAP